MKYFFFMVFKSNFAILLLYVFSCVDGFVY